MASAVATALEREFSTIAGLESMSSMSTQGGTQITLQFSLSRNIDAASQDVQAAIARSQGRLPADMPGAALLPESEPGRPARALHGGLLRYPCALHRR